MININLILLITLIVVNYIVIKKYRNKHRNIFIFLAIIDIIVLYFISNNNPQNTNYNEVNYNRFNNMNLINKSGITTSFDNNIITNNKTYDNKLECNEYINLENCKSDGTCMNTPDNYKLLPNDLEDIGFNTRKDSICNCSNIVKYPLCKPGEKVCPCDDNNLVGEGELN